MASADHTQLKHRKLCVRRSHEELNLDEVLQSLLRM